MAEEENWTVVNSSKTRGKKDSAPNSNNNTRSGTEGGTSSAKPPHQEGQDPRRKFQDERGGKSKNKNANNAGRREGQSQGHASHALPRASGQSESQPQPWRKKFEKPKPEATNDSSKGPTREIPAKRVVVGSGSPTWGPSQTQPFRLLKRGTDSSFAAAAQTPVQKGRDVIKGPSKYVESKAKVSNKTPAPNSQDSKHPGQSSTINKIILPVNTQQQQQRPPQQGNPGGSSASPKQESSESGPADAAPKKKPRKRDSKEVRRKKREEKFYQALYQKDSHIQFVSADVIRQMKNDSSDKYSAAKSRNRTATVSSDASTSLQNQTISETEPFQSFGDFPSLTPSSTSGTPVPGPSYRLACSTKPTPIAENTTVPVDELCSLSVAESKPAPVTPASAKGKKSKLPFVIDVSELIVKKKERDADKRNKEALSTPQGRISTLKKNHRLTAGNPLDASGPGVIHRGKIRDKKKKPTKLKLTILKSRALRMKLLGAKEKQEEGESSSGSDGIAVSSGEEKFVKTDEYVAIKEESTGNPLLESSSVVQAEMAEAAALNVNIPYSSFTEHIKLEIITFNSNSPMQDTDESKEIPAPANHSLLASDVVENGTKSIPIIDSSPSPLQDFPIKFFQLLDEVSMLKIEETIPNDIEAIVKKSMHNRKFRDYCDMYTSKELHRIVISLLSELFRFQDRLYHTDPIKFKTKRRFVSGLKEAVTYLNLNKVQLLLIAPDIEKNPEPGGLDDKINQILTLARGNNVPYVFSGSKYTLGKPTRVKTPISIISILDKQNCEETFRNLLSEANLLREKYQNDFITKVQEHMKSET